jgi:Tol biopolymer transport system component
MNADGSSAAPLTRFAAAFSFHPVFSPDGTKLAFLSNRGLDGSDVFTGASNIWVAKADGSGAIPLTKYTAAGAGAAQGFTAWSPDGKKLAFASNAALDGSDAVSTNSTSNVWVANADGSGATPLTKLTYPGVAAGAFPYGWSTDSANLVFVSDGALDGSNVRIFSNVWVMKADGSNIMPLTRTGGASPAWKP